MKVLGLEKAEGPEEWAAGWASMGQETRELEKAVGPGERAEGASRGTARGREAWGQVEVQVVAQVVGVEDLFRF